MKSLVDSRKIDKTTDKTLKRQRDSNSIDVVGRRRKSTSDQSSMAKN